MYNLLISAAQDAWDKGFYEYDRSRFLEYSNDEIVKKFNKKYEDLIQLPCLFGYEQYENQFKIGNLKSINFRGNKILIDFEICHELREFTVEKINDISTLLDIRNWEINRTHWAVKDEDLFERLLEMKLITKKYFNNGKNKFTSSIINASQNDKYIMSLNGFIKKVFEIKSENTQTVFYRGHSKKYGYRLVPSLFRTDKNGNYKYLQNEAPIYREMLIANASEFENYRTTLDILMKMQHYSVPTRLLDITSNPLIALYFACKSNPDTEGEVIIFKIKTADIKYFDSDTVSCLANLARLQKKEQDNIDFNAQDFNKQLPIRRLVHFIKEEKPFFKNEIKPEDLQRVVCVKGKYNNNRITSQSGAFFLFGLNAVLDEIGNKSILVERISIRNKNKILEELNKLNINESTVFPYIENSAKFIAQKYEFKN